MPVSTLDHKNIELLQDIADLIPVTRQYYENWNIRVFDRAESQCKNYLSPNRREFYKVLFITKGAGIFTLGANTYYVDEPTIFLFIQTKLFPGKISLIRQADIILYLKSLS